MTKIFWTPFLLALFIFCILSPYIVDLATKPTMTLTLPAETTFLPIEEESRVEEESNPFYFLPPEDLRAPFAYLCMKYDLDPEIMFHLISAESNWEVTAKSRANFNGSRDWGLMQLNDNYFDYFSDRYYNGKEFDWSDPVQNMEIGFAHFSHLKDKAHGDYEKALISYNWGRQNLLLAQAGYKKVPRVVLAYVEKIM